MAIVVRGRHVLQGECRKKGEIAVGTTLRMRNAFLNAWIPPLGLHFENNRGIINENRTILWS